MNQDLMTGPLVSIGIPLYNESAYVKRTVDSALAQSYRNIEIIVSDNCSTDNTYDILTSEFKDIENLRIYRQPKNIGPNANFEFLMHQANGEFFMWLGGHDAIHPEYVAMAVKVHGEHPDSSLVYFQHQFLDHELNFIQTPPLPSIASHHLSRNLSAIKVFNALNYCTHIHGVWRLKHRPEIEFTKYFGPDHLILFIMSLCGSIHEISQSYYLRVVNRSENSEDMIKRYKSYGYNLVDGDLMYTLYESHQRYLLRKLRLVLFLKLALMNKRFFRKFFLRTFILMKHY